MKLSTTVLIELLVVFVDCIDPEILNTNIFSTTVTTPTTSTIRTSTWPTATTETSPTTSWITSSSPLPSTTTTTTSTTPPTTTSSTTTSTTRPTTTSSTTTSTTRPTTTSSTTTSTTRPTTTSSTTTSTTPPTTTSSTTTSTTRPTTTSSTTTSTTRPTTTSSTTTSTTRPTTTSSTTTSTTRPTTTSSTTTSTTPPTTTSSTTTSTTRPTTTSSTTTSTTPPTTTSSTTTSTTRPTTTSSTTTPTTRPTTTTPSPTPTPKPPIPEKGIWMVNHTDNSTCIYLEMATSIEFYYINIRNEIDKGQINIPVQARVVGSCGEGDRHRQTIKLLWNFNSLLANTLEFVFRRNSHMYELDKVILNVTLDSEDFPTVKDADKTLILINKNMHFLTPENRSYKCTKPHTLSLHQQRNNVDIGKMKIMHLHFQAFGNITNGHLAKAMDCKPHHPSRSLFILLGAVIILFVIISVTYMITRSRHPIYGYSIVDKDGNRCESERTKLWRQSDEIPRDLTNVQTITEKEINVKMPYNSVKFLMTKFGKN